MNLRPSPFFIRHGKCLTAIAMIVTAFGFARLPDLPRGERARLAARFQFTRTELPEIPGVALHTLRDVSPPLRRISGWISAVGAAVALADLDRDGLPNDVINVDTRTNLVIVSPAPGTPRRYAPFTLDPAPLSYNPATMAPMGCLPGDFNEDGLTDVLVYYWGRTPIIFLRKAGDAGADQAPLRRDLYLPVEAVSHAERWYTNAATQADLDGDGHVDLVFGNYFPESAHILDASSTAPDYMQNSMSRAYNGGRNRLMLWAGARSGSQPSVTFRDVQGVLADEIAHGWTLAVGAQDLDGDLRPELYFANDFGPDRLLYNRSTPGRLRFELLSGQKTLTTPNSKVLGRDSFKGMGVDFGDLNGDGIPDIYVSNITAEYALEESHFAFVSTGEIGAMRHGRAPYADESEPLGLSRSGWSWESRLDDFDNDGVLEAMQATGFLKGENNRWPELQELAIGNDQLLHLAGCWPRFQPGDDLSGHQHNPFFVRAKNGRYCDVAPELHLDDTEVSRGIATADVDGDGNLDFAVANQWEPSYFYSNRCPHPGAFLGIHLLLPLVGQDPGRLVIRSGHPGQDTPGRPAIGAAVMVHLPDGRRLVRQVDGGNGHSGKRSPDLHLGLGSIPQDRPLRVDLAWRDIAGGVHRQGLELAPGYHTVLLGGTIEERR